LPLVLLNERKRRSGQAEKTKSIVGKEEGIVLEGLNRHSVALIEQSQ